MASELLFLCVSVAAFGLQGETTGLAGLRPYNCIAGLPRFMELAEGSLGLPLPKKEQLEEMLCLAVPALACQPMII